MICITPPALTEATLLAWIDGYAPPEVNSHLAQCPYCRTQAERLISWQKQLATQLYRIDCPPSLELGEYHLGLLGAEQMLAVAEHVTHCLHCAREIQTLQGYLNPKAPKQAPVAPRAEQTPIPIWIATLVEALSGLGSGGRSTPAFAQLRGEQAEQLVYNADDFQITIEVQPDTVQPDRKVILGLVLGLAADQTLAVHLWQTNHKLATTTVDDLGNFVFSSLPTGAYELIFSNPAFEIHIQDLKV